MAEANVAVLIDYENVGLDSIQYLLDQISDVGRITIKRAYADWSTQRNKRDQLLELGIEAIHHFRSTKSGKNSSDIRLVIDAIDLQHTSDVDTFVVVSSDSDFVPLVMHLRAAGKSVMAAGRRDTTPLTLVKSCDRYIYLDEGTPPPATENRTRTRRPRQAGRLSLLTRAVEASMDEGGQVVGSKLYQTMLRIDPSFDFRAMGHRTFRQFLRDSKEVQVTQPSDASDVVVQLKQAPAPATAGRSAERDRDPAPAASRKSAARDGAAAAEKADEDEGSLTLDQEKEIDAAWDNRGGPKITGQAAAASVAKVFGVSSLKAAGFASIDKLLQTSRLLQARWRRERNTVQRR